MNRNGVQQIIVVVFALVFYETCFAQQKMPGNLTDMNVCKVSHLGLDYEGSIGQTESLVRCQSWTATNPIHKMNPAYTDETFSDFSKQSAKSYCRNPSKDPTGPWCYTMDEQLINETCAIPLCSFSQCRLTGPGMEYGGSSNAGISDRKCLKWNKKRNKVRLDGKLVKLKKFAKDKFPENDLAEAGKFCRNPDGDIGGPWCFVEVEGSNEVEKEYCDIPLCNEINCPFLSKEHDIYSHFTYTIAKESEIEFGIRVWNPDSYMDAEVRIALTVVALPLPTDSIHKGEYGIEIFISNKKSGLTAGNAEKVEFEATPHVLKATEFTFFTLSWGGSFITLNKVGTSKPLFIAQYRMKDNLLSHFRDTFFYYSVRGENMYWALPYCNEEGRCNVHKTTSGYFQRFWPLGRSNVGYEFRFFNRAFRSAKILLVPSPAISYPRIEIHLGARDNFTRITSTKYKDAASTTLFEISNLKLLDYFSWREFSLALFAESLSVYKVRETGSFLVAEAKAEEIKIMRWFSISSDNTVAYWTFFCKPTLDITPPPALLPDCALDAKELQYSGYQGTTSDGYPCLPWASIKLHPEGSDHGLSKENALKAFNYCRDPKKEHLGTYCYAVIQEKKTYAKKVFCRVNRCKSSECKTAGTGNDYIGKVSTTRSNRTCQFWSAKPPSVQNQEPPSAEMRNYFGAMIRPPNQNPAVKRPSSDFEHLLNMHNISIYKDTKSGKDIMLVHGVREEYMNDSLYADMSVGNAENFCRNPGRNMGGNRTIIMQRNFIEISNVF